MKLSHSGLNKYLTCPRSYKYRYVERVVSKYKSGALYFGTALDNALNVLLETKDAEKAKACFDENWLEQTDNEYKKVSLVENEFVTYAEADYDPDLLNKKDWADIFQARARIYGADADFTPWDKRKQIKEVKSKKGWPNVAIEDRRFYNYMNWLSMRKKGHMMLDAYVTKVLPRLTNVVSVQKVVALPGVAEVEPHGIVDLISHVDGSETPLILDNKTAAREYEPDAVLKSTQLAMYTVILNEMQENGEKLEWKGRIDHAGFIVLLKNIEKEKTKICKTCNFLAEDGSRHTTCHNEIDGHRCGGQWEKTVKCEVKVQFIVDKVPDMMQDLVIENINEVHHGIKSNVFPKNVNACEGKFGRCEYWAKCHLNKEDDLIHLPEKK